MRAKLILCAGPLVPETPGVTSSPGALTQYELGAFNTLGRHPDNSIQVLDRIVSKEHARIISSRDGKFVLRDVGSLNGTFINDTRIDEHELSDGDVIVLGGSTFRFEQDTRLAQQPQARVTMMAGQIESDIHSTFSNVSRFRPSHEISDIAELRADYEKLRVAHLFAEKLAIDPDLDQVLQKVVGETLSLIAADRAIILLIDPKTDELVPTYVQEKRQTNEEIQLSSSILDEVRTKRKAVLCSDALIDERFKTAKSVILQGIRSTMCVPLLVGDELLGVFHIDSMLASGAFTNKDLAIFSGIATQAAVAILNQRLAARIEYEASTRATLQKLLSPNVVNQILSGELELEQGGTQCQVTMIFADIRGFTEMCERHPPATMVQTLNEYFEVVVDILFRHGGTLDKYVGDEIIGLFGAPVPIEDAALHAVRCGLDMMRAVEEFNHQRVQRGDEPIEIGIGINSGTVIAGAIGSTQTLQYTVIGDAVNIASRLCAVASPGELIVSSSTYEACRESVVANHCDPVRVKGKSQPLDIYQIIGLHDRGPAPPDGTTT